MTIDFTEPIFSVTIYNLFLYFVPGYITIHVFAYILHYKFEISFNEKTAISVITSVAFYVLLTIVLNIQLEGWNYLFLGLPIIATLIITSIYKKMYRPKYYSDTAWVSFGKRNIGKYVEITTIHNKKYYGYLSIVSNQDEQSHDICLKDPYIYQDKISYDIGEEILFLEHAISSIRVIPVA